MENLDRIDSIYEMSDLTYQDVYQNIQIIVTIYLNLR